MADILTSIGDALGWNKGKATIDAANANKGILTGLRKEGMGYIDTGAQKAEGALRDSLGLTSLGPEGAGIYRDALGLGGDAGTTRALDTFHQGPGYEYQLDQGQQAINRNAAASGRLNSGQTDLDTLRFSQGLADQDWQKWLDNLNLGINREVAGNGDLASLYTGTAGQKAAFAGDIGSGLLAANNQAAGGAEAGQGYLWDTLGNVAGIAGSFAGLNKTPGGGKTIPAASGSLGSGIYGREWA